VIIPANTQQSRSIQPNALLIKPGDFTYTNKTFMLISMEVPIKVNHSNKHHPDPDKNDEEQINQADEQQTLPDEEAVSAVTYPHTVLPSNPEEPADEPHNGDAEQTDEIQPSLHSEQYPDHLESGPARSGNKLPIIIGAVVVGLALIGGGGFAFMNMNQENEEPEVATPAKPKITTNSSVDEVLVFLSKEVPKAYTFLKTEQDSRLVVSRRVPEYEFVASAAVLNTISFKPSTEGSLQSLLPVVDDVSRTFLQAGFVADQIFTKEDAQKGGTRAYQRKDEACDVQYGVGFIYLKCTNMVNITETAAKVKPLYEAHIKAEPKNNDWVYGLPEFHDSKTAGFKWASVGVGSVSGPDGFAAYFYAKNDQWKYLTSTQNTLDCRKAEAIADARKAFMGEKCVDTRTQQERTVK
jgi:hypothetical protein